MVRGVGMMHCRAGFGPDQETHAFPRPGAGRGPDQQCVPAIQRQAPGVGGAGAGRGLRGHGWFWSHPAGSGRGIRLCHGRGGGNSGDEALVLAGTGNARVPRPGAGRGPVQRCVLSPRKANAPRRVRSARSKGGARALAVASGATAGPGRSGGMWQRCQPLPWERGILKHPAPGPGGIRKRMRSPAPAQAGAPINSPFL
jgi:hypothetical protein